MLKPRIVCPAKLKDPYKKVIEYLEKLTGIKVEQMSKEKIAKLTGFKVLLDQRGKPWKEEEIKDLLKSREVIFIVGGPYGLKREEINADRIISFGNYTLGHQIALIVLLEQLFRLMNQSHGYNKK